MPRRPPRKLRRRPKGPEEGWEAAASAAEDREAAEKAAEEAKAAQKAAEEARKSAEDAKSAAELAAGLPSSPTKGSRRIPLRRLPSTQRRWLRPMKEIVRIKAELVEYLAKAQAEAERAEAERKAAEEAQREGRGGRSGPLPSMPPLTSWLSSRTARGLTGHAKEAYDKALARRRCRHPRLQRRPPGRRRSGCCPRGSEQRLCPSAAFTDVEENVWYHDGIDFMVRNGYMNGVAADTFDVEGSLTRPARHDPLPHRQ